MKKVRFPKKELNLWLKNHLCWNHEEWLMLIDTLGKSGFSYWTQNKELIYEMVDFHSARPGHDLRYSLDGEKMKEMGWVPSNIRERIQQVVKWTLDNKRWLAE